MELLLKRKTANPQCTLGELLIGTRFECFTLEDQVREDPNPLTPQNEAKVYAATAIPAGRYRVHLAMSPRFGKVYPRLEGVPGFTGILIHAGNTHEDTKGCILVGSKVVKNSLVQSKVAFDHLMVELRAATDRKEEIWITVEDTFKTAA